MQPWQKTQTGQLASFVLKRCTLGNNSALPLHTAALHAKWVWHVEAWAVYVQWQG